MTRPPSRDTVTVGVSKNSNSSDSGEQKAAAAKREAATSAGCAGATTEVTANAVAAPKVKPPPSVAPNPKRQSANRT